MVTCQHILACQHILKYRARPMHRRLPEHLCHHVIRNPAGAQPCTRCAATRKVKCKVGDAGLLQSSGPPLSNVSDGLLAVDFGLGNRYSLPGVSSLWR